MEIRLMPLGFVYLLLVIVIVYFGISNDWISHFQPNEEGQNTIFYNLFVSFFAGLCLAMSFFILLRPRVKISNKISKRVNKEGKTYYTFKFINNSFFSAFDVNIEAYICKKSNATLNGDGVNLSLEPVELTRKKWIYIANWKPVFNTTEYAHHCTTVRTFHENLTDKIQGNSSYLEFRITLKHAFSNLSSTYKMRYMNEKCIEEGEFHFGNSLKIT